MPAMNPDLLDATRNNVLCWLATADADGTPNVSPKEMWTMRDEHTLLIAHIASPVSVRNIRSLAAVSVALLDIFRQKGVKLAGTAEVVDRDDVRFPELHRLLTERFGDAFPVSAILVVRILAPSYLLRPGTTERDQMAAAWATYRLDDLHDLLHAP